MPEWGVLLSALLSLTQRILLARQESQEESCFLFRRNPAASLLAGVVIGSPLRPRMRRSVRSCVAKSRWRSPLPLRWRRRPSDVAGEIEQMLDGSLWDNLTLMFRATIVCRVPI